MKLKLLSPAFETKKYFKEKLKDIGEIPKQLKHLNWDGTTCPTFNAEEIYDDYYKRALAGKITQNILRGHQNIVDECSGPYEVDSYKEISYEEEGIEFKDVVFQPGGTYNLFNPPIPMVEQFALFAALSNVYLENKDLDQSYAFAIRAAQVWGSLNRFRRECLNSLAVNRESTAPLLMEKEIKEGKVFFGRSKGGKMKGINADTLAEIYWDTCANSPEFRGWIERYPSMGLKFSDELYNYIKTRKPTKDCPGMLYASRWFYDEVVSKFRPKNKKLTTEEKIQFSLKSVQNSKKAAN